MHARCNLGVHDMNNTILMVSSAEDCAGNSVASLKGMCLCLAQARLRATDTRSAFTVYRSTKQTKVMEPYNVIRAVC